MQLSNKMYDILKPITSTVLPAAAALYIALASLWGWSNPEQVAGTIAAINTFLGALLLLSTKKFSEGDGTIVATRTDDGATNYSLVYNGDPADIQTKDRISFRVQK